MATHGGEGYYFTTTVPVTSNTTAGTSYTIGTTGIFTSGTSANHTHSFPANSYFSDQWQVSVSAPPLPGTIHDILKESGLFDAAGIKKMLEDKLSMLEALEDGLVGEVAEYLSDAMFFLVESIEALKKITGE